MKGERLNAAAAAAAAAVAGAAARHCRRHGPQPRRPHTTKTIDTNDDAWICACGVRAFVPLDTCPPAKTTRTIADISPPGYG